MTAGGKRSKHTHTATKSVCPSLRRNASLSIMLAPASGDVAEAGVDRAVIALWLDHESVETTQIYLEATLAMKAKRLPDHTTQEVQHASEQMIGYEASSTVY